MSRYFFAITEPIRPPLRQHCHTLGSLYRMVDLHETPVVPRCTAKRNFFSSLHLCHACPSRPAKRRNLWVGPAVPSGPSARPSLSQNRNLPPKKSPPFRIFRQISSVNISREFGIAPPPPNLSLSPLTRTEGPSFLRFYTFSTFVFKALTLPNIGETDSLQKSRLRLGGGIHLIRRAK